MRARLIFTGILTLTVAVAVHAQDVLPDGEGRDIVEYVCSQCHDLLQVTQASKTHEQWRFIVTSMRNQGAPLEEHEIDTVVRYLTEHFGQ